LEKGAEDKERGKTIVSGSEIRDSGDKIDSPQTDSENGVWSERSAREADFDVHEQASSANTNRPRALESLASIPRTGTTRTSPRRTIKSSKKFARSTMNTA
jgi:hypothetical protein